MMLAAYAARAKIYNITESTSVRKRLCRAVSTVSGVKPRSRERFNSSIWTRAKTCTSRLHFSSLSGKSKKSLRCRSFKRKCALVLRDKWSRSVKCKDGSTRIFRCVWRTFFPASFLDSFKSESLLIAPTPSSTPSMKPLSIGLTHPQPAQAMSTPTTSFPSTSTSQTSTVSSPDNSNSNNNCKKARFDWTVSSAELSEKLAEPGDHFLHSEEFTAVDRKWQVYLRHVSKRPNKIGFYLQRLSGSDGRFLVEMGASKPVAIRKSSSHPWSLAIGSSQGYSGFATYSELAAEGTECVQLSVDISVADDDAAMQ